MMLSEFQLDALRELVNIGVGRAAQSLNMMLSEHIQLTVPVLHLVESLDSIDPSVPFPTGQVAAVTQSFSGGVMDGQASLVFPRDSALHFVQALTGEQNEDADLDVLYEGTLSEIGNIVISGLFGSIANAFGQQRFTFSIPEFAHGTSPELLQKNLIMGVASTGILAEVSFSIQRLDISGYILMIFTSDSLNSFVELLEASLGRGSA